MVVISMNTQNSAARRAEEEMANGGDQVNQVPPSNNQVPPLEKVVMGDHVPDAPSPLTDRDIRAAFHTLTQAMTSKANVITYQVKDMMVEINREVGNEFLNMLTIWPRV